MRCLIVLLALIATIFATPLLYRPQSQMNYGDWQEGRMDKRSNAELINGLIGMDLGKLSAVGKRSNAELINGLLGMNLNKLRLKMNILCSSWVGLSFTIALLQLLNLSQPEWIVNGQNIQGLFAICSPGTHCYLRNGSSLTPLAFQLAGSFLFLLSAIALIPVLWCTHTAKPVQVVAHIQIVAAIMTTICLFTSPLDMSAIGCSIPLLIRSFHCRIGWAMASSAICCMLSIACPVFGRLVSDQRKQYRILTSREHFF